MSLLPSIVGVLALLAPAPPAPALLVSAATAEAVVRAVVAAVRARMGDEAEVSVEAVRELALPGGMLTDAVPAPGATLGAAARFVLRGPGAAPADPSRRLPVGYVVVALRVTSAHAHTTKALRRGVALEAADLMPARHAFATGALTRPPSLDDAVHGRVLQDLPADACLTRRVFATVPAVRAGADVVAIVRSGGIEARADLVSVDRGNPGDMVRVTNPRSRRTFRARVVSRDLVEIVPTATDNRAPAPGAATQGPEDCDE